MYLVTSAEIQAMDRMTIESFGIPGRVLMENAGRGATRLFLTHFAEVARRARESGKDVSETGMAELDRYWEEAKKKS